MNGGMLNRMRIFRIWLLLRRLQRECYEVEAEHPNHFTETGHNFSLAVPEHAFLDEVSGGNLRKRAALADLLRIADERMHLLDARTEKHKCDEPDCKNTVNVKLIHLNDDGLEFVGFLEFMEYLGKNYPISWGAVGKFIALIAATAGGISTVFYFFAKAVELVLIHWPHVQ